MTRAQKRAAGTATLGLNHAARNTLLQHDTSTRNERYTRGVRLPVLSAIPALSQNQHEALRCCTAPDGRYVRWLTIGA
jgi:hypothetical protein